MIQCSSAQLDVHHCIQSLRAKLHTHSEGSHVQWMRAALAVVHNESFQDSTIEGRVDAVAYEVLVSLHHCSGTYYMPCAKVYRASAIVSHAEVA